MKYLLLLFPTQVLAGPFFSLGIGVHSPADRPEINLDRTVAVVELGYRKNNYSLKYIHISGLKTKEQGYGLNVFSINYTKEFK